MTGPDRNDRADLQGAPVEPWGIEGARAALARNPEANPDQDPAVLRLELDAAREEIARLRGLLTEAYRGVPLPRRRW